jgi:hypothetical protein
MLEGIMAVAADGPPRHRPLSRKDEALRAARTCYDHFAGRLGVALADALVERGSLVLSDEGGEVTERGMEFLCEFGIDLSNAPRRRHFCRPCLDWTERRLHVGGAIGAALTARCFDLGWAARARDSRAVTITEDGRRGFDETFGLAL